MYSAFVKNQYLFLELVKKDIKAKYEGTIFGVLWSILYPLIMLAVYTFVFSEILGVKWGIDIDNNFSFALMLFCGLSLFNMFSEIISKSVNLVASNKNYVKKVLFPIEILPNVITFSALFNCIISYVILLIANLILTGNIYATSIQGIIIIVPFIFYCLGLSYLTSALAVYLKDLVNVIPVLLTIGMYVSPIFFSIDALPEEFRIVIYLNPMTYSIENMRNVILYGKNMDLIYFSISVITALLFYFVGEIIFKRARTGFADLL